MMRYALVLMTILVIGCAPEQKKAQLPFVNFEEEDWSKRKIDIDNMDSLVHGKSYLSVYSQMYSYTQHQKYNLTGMISLRNISDVDTIYFLKADYFNTEGANIRTYFDFPIFVLPMETLEIVIDQIDVEGGTGSNLLFEWKTPMNCPEPVFEGVMNSMQGTQGVAFTTYGRRVK